MSARNAYTALTPDYADFAEPHTPAQSSHSRTAEPEEHDIDDIGFELPRSRRRGTKLIGRMVERVTSTTKANAGLLLVTGSQAFFSLMNLAVKKLHNVDPPVPTHELILVRMGMTWILSVTYMLVTKVPDPFLGPKGVRLWLWFRGFSGFFGLFGIYFSLQYLSLSDAIVLTFLSPLFTGIAGALFLKETFHRNEAFASLFSLLGVVLIARPPFIFGDYGQNGSAAEAASGSTSTIDQSEKGTPAQRLLAVGVSMLGVLGATGAYISIRAIGKRAHPLHVMTQFASHCVVVAIVAMIVYHTRVVIPTRIEWLALLVLTGVSGFVGQILLTMGLQRETAGRGSVAVYSQVVFATIFERIFFKSTPSALSIVGTLLIVSSALYVALTKEHGRADECDAIEMSRSKSVTGAKTITPSGVGREEAAATMEEGLLENANEDDTDEESKETHSDHEH